MADIGYVRTLLTGLEDEKTRRILMTVFEHVLGNLRFGEPDHQARATNFQLYAQVSTTASDTGEFSIAHGLPTAPHLAIPVLDLSATGASIVPLTVTRAADTKRLYLKSGSTSMPIVLLVE